MMDDCYYSQVEAHSGRIEQLLQKLVRKKTEEELLDQMLAETMKSMAEFVKM